MALFKTHHPRRQAAAAPCFTHFRNGSGLPEKYKRLDILCHCLKNHPLPVRMKFIGWGTSDHGQPMAVYACPHKDCGSRQGWVKDFRTNRPIRLFTKS
jgi:hypothetical protein